MKWKEYLLSDLFDIKTTKSVDKNKMELKNDAPYAFIGRTPTNWGVQGFVDKLDFAPNPKDTFSLVQVGETVALWREKEWYASQNLFLLQPKLQKIKDVYLYFQTVINKEMSLYGKAYNSYPTIKSLNNTYISLPVKGVEEKIDWDYMESYMNGVMEETEKRIENLKKVDDTKNLIDVSAWKEFRVGDLFAIHPTKAYKLTNAQLLDDGDYPVIANSAYNNGIGGYSTKEPTENGNMVTFSDTVDANTIFYQPNDFVGYPHVQGLYPLKYEDKWNEYTYSFFVSIFRGSAISKGFDYGNKFRRDIAVDLIIKLPATSDGQPDWGYMENYMKQIEQKAAKKLELLQVTRG